MQGQINWHVSGGIRIIGYPYVEAKRISSSIKQILLACRVSTHFCADKGGIGIVIISPWGASFEFAFPAEPMITNNQAEYEAIFKGLQLLHEVKAEAIEVFGDSQLIIN